MNWGFATIILVSAVILEVIAVEVLRSIIHRKREERYGIGGTQDIAMWNMLIGWLLVILALICGAVWLISR